MLLSKTQRKEKKIAAIVPSQPAQKSNDSLLLEYIEKRDYSGAISFIQMIYDNGKVKDETLAFLHFHNGDHVDAKNLYEKLLENTPNDDNFTLNLAVCQFYVGDYSEADRLAKNLQFSGLQNRLLFHLSHKLKDEKRLFNHHRYLEDVAEDHMTLASVHYLRGHYQEAIDVYKKLLSDNSDHFALNIYLAMCYFKLEYFDICQEYLSIYLQKYPETFIGLMLQACTIYKMFDGRKAELLVKELEEKCSSSFKFNQDVIELNKCVFKSCDTALQVLPKLLDSVPEATLNLVLYHLRSGDIESAFKLIKDYEPVNNSEIIIKAVTFASYGQLEDSPEILQEAQDLYKAVGTSSIDCDTIPGRQCMASALILDGKYEEALVYLESTKAYLMNDDTFNFNYGQVKTANGEWIEAIEHLSRVKSEALVQDFKFVECSCRCSDIMLGKPQLAWDLFLGMETSVHSFKILRLLSSLFHENDHFVFAVKAFDYLENLDGSRPEFVEGKTASCLNAFRDIVRGNLDARFLQEVVQALRNSPNITALTRQYISIMQRWAKSNGIMLL